MKMNTEIKYPESIGAEITIPMKPPFVYLDKPRDDTILNGDVDLEFPNECAWCGSKKVKDTRLVKLYKENPQYQSHGKRLLTEGIALAAAAVGGSNIVGYTMYGTLKPQELAKVKGFSLEIEVPCCEEHANVSPEDVLAFSKSGIQVRDAKYARRIMRLNNPTINLSSLKNLLFTDRCVVCGEMANTRYEAIAEGSADPEDKSIEVPICNDDLQKAERIKKAGKPVYIFSGIAGVMVGALTFAISDMGIGGHLLCFGGAGLVGFFLFAVMVELIVARLFIHVDGFAWKPISITFKDDQYIIEFKDTKVAEAIRRINDLD